MPRYSRHRKSSSYAEKTNGPTSRGEHTHRGAPARTSTIPTATKLPNHVPNTSPTVGAFVGGNARNLRPKPTGTTARGARVSQQPIDGRHSPTAIDGRHSPTRPTCQQHTNERHQCDAKILQPRHEAVELVVSEGAEAHHDEHADRDRPPECHETRKQCWRPKPCTARHHGACVDGHHTSRTSFHGCRTRTGRRTNASPAELPELPR